MKQYEDQLSEQLSQYLHESDAAEYVSLPKKINYAQLFQNKLLLVFAIRNGLPYAVFELIQLHSPFSLHDWADLLNISYKSIQRYKAQQARFKPTQSEKIFEVAEVLESGTEVFGDVDKLKLWLDTPSYALGNMKPVELMHDSYGKELVMAEITRIDHGIFA
ncbi:MAG: antitoxin Xre/MbcA/ParS toxin-binding domain-containing protein [Cyclobacteriaceae bacterium]